MAIDLSVHILNFRGGNEILISSQKTKALLASVCLDPSFILAKLPGAPELESSHLGTWVEVHRLDGDPTTVKTYLVSMQQLQLALDKKIREESLGKAVEIGDVVKVIGLLSQGPIADHYLVDALVSAAEHRHTPIVSLLLQNRAFDVSESARGRATLAGAGSGAEEIVRQLLEKGSISEDARQWAVVSAALGQHEGIVRQLLEKGPISESTYRTASRSLDPHSPIQQLLLAKVQISSDVT